MDENIEGFLSIDDISWTRKIKHPREVLKRGEEVEVKILDINKENRRISVGMKQVTEDPWPILEGLYVPGAVIEAEISRVGEQVAYVNLQYGIEGIIPLPEAMSDKKAGKKMKVGDKVKLKVEDLNKAEKRIVLSLVREGKKKREKSQIADLLEVREATSKIEIPEEIIEKIKETEKPGEEAESSERKSEKSEKKERETKKVRRTRKKKDEDKTD